MACNDLESLMPDIDKIIMVGDVELTVIKNKVANSKCGGSGKGAGR